MPLPAKFGAGGDLVFAPEEPLWTARPVTRPGEFTPGIEGPACDADGNIFAVNYREQGTIGRISPNGSGEVFLRLPEDSVGNGIRFDGRGNFYIADYVNHNIWQVNQLTRELKLLAHNDAMNQPNDLAIADDGTLYASDPNWPESTGQLWRIDPDGTTTLLAENMGTTNGIDVSPDGKTLYVNESIQRNVWAFTINADKTLSGKRLVRKFEDHGFDGMRVDVDGNLYISRYGKGTVVKMTPTGDILQEVSVLGLRPSNVCFGGPDGCTVYVTEVESTRLVRFRVDRPGRSWKAFQK
ncbi:MAG: SMP-30/gluconolactonase/LRE family protein [Planctomycetaceae bacterium]|nr:SMP-30/gluconolactonase/LRE family protein [Planctomycetaceae bacterium]